MRQVIELIRKHPKMRRILRCESSYFHHCWVDCAADVSDRFCDMPGHGVQVHWLLIIIIIQKCAVSFNTTNKKVVMV